MFELSCNKYLAAAGFRGVEIRFDLNCFLKYFSSFAAVKISKKRVQRKSAAKDEKYFSM